MKILYLSDTDLDQMSGVARKILMQCQRWEKEGHEVEILSMNSMSWYSTGGERLTAKSLLIKRRGWKVFLHLAWGTFLLQKMLQGKSYDIVYMRYRLYFPFFKKALGRARQIVEINTDDLEEYKLSSSLLSMYNRYFRHFFLSKVDAFVCVSRELGEKFKIFHRPVCVIANGIDCSQYEFVPMTQTQKPSLVFIGSPGQKWHGVEKIVWLADRLPEFDFHIVGIDGASRKNLYYHGYQPHDKAQEIVKTKDVGIGTLSLYVNKMTEASPLKTRQYLAHGLPLIYAYEDTDISAEVSFALRIANNENNVTDTLDEIKRFIFAVYQNRSIRKKARSFAEEKLDVKGKEKKRLHFFEKVLENRS
jgi:glycosyltransferase involved in cell wall biosynthesis